MLQEGQGSLSKSIVTMIPGAGRVCPTLFVYCMNLFAYSTKIARLPIQEINSMHEKMNLELFRNQGKKWMILESVETSRE